MFEHLGVSKDQLYLFNNGKDYESYNVFGAHLYNKDGESGVRFLVYAPNASSVRVVGDFNDWNDNAHMMDFDSETGTWCIFIPGLKEYEVYKYVIIDKKGEKHFKADPYAFFSELRPHTASIVYDLENFNWTDAEFIKQREHNDHFLKPKNIYECHLGSFMQNPDKEKRMNPEEIPESSFMNYIALADKLIPYVKEMGYTHIEIMPLSEYPYDGSWGYQATGYFSITSRYGTPKDFMYFVNKCHEAGLYLIMDWVPGHFCKDEHGLYKFDGDYLFDGKEHKHWGTMTFNYSKSEVISFLYSSAVFYIKKFHIDGIRVDGVSSMLYLNYGVENPAEKVFNKYGDEGNLEAIEFLQNFNEMIGREFKGVITIAEESTAWPNVTKPKEIGGLGFHYKWDMGWMNDTLNYMKTDFPYRTKDHNRLTFSMMYADSENYIMPLSHDEVVHGKGSLVNKMPGTYEEKFMGLRNLLLYQITRPGGKLCFMGADLAEFIEWRYYESLEWFLLDYDIHKKHNQYVKDLNHLYLTEKALWELDFHIWDSFQWIDADNREQNIFIYERKGIQERDRLLVLINFGKQSFEKFRFGVSLPGVYREIMNTNDIKYAGTGSNINTEDIISDEIGFHNKDESIEVSVPALSAMIFKLVDDLPYVIKNERLEKKKKEEASRLEAERLEAEKIEAEKENNKESL